MEQNQPLLIDFMLRHAWHRVSRMYNNTASTEGMTMSVGFILMIIEKSGTPSTQPVSYTHLTLPTILLV